MPSVRAEVVTRRTYNRPLDTEGRTFETWDQTCDRVIEHQKWLAEGAGAPIGLDEQQELRELLLSRKTLPAGRTLWLGGTETGKRRAASQFNCSFLEVSTVYDMVDLTWLLLQGCGVGFKPVPGTLRGFVKPLEEVKIIYHDNSPDKKGVEENHHTLDGDYYGISVGDSAEAWAKAIGKILLCPSGVRRLHIGMENIRGPGKRLSGYGWICAGAKPFGAALEKIIAILNEKAGQLLSEIDILDICNLIGTILSSRRSAQIALLDHHNPRWREFARAKKDFWLFGREHRQQSNNSLLFEVKPTKDELADIFRLLVDSGGSEPGFINAAAARRRAPWFKGANPCCEILLANKGFCNLVETNLAAFNGCSADLMRAQWLIARVNYRQTLVDLHDGILQPAWHQTNESLRLCGTGLTGIARSTLTAYEVRQLRTQSILGAYSLADELGLERPKNVTTIKPSGTLSKIMDTTEGIHKPLAKHIFNWISFSQMDPLVPRLEKAGYKTLVNPNDPQAVLVAFPVCWEDVEFTDIGNGRYVNTESAITQLERYRFWMNNWCDQNVSNTISYSIEEIPQIIDWLDTHWDDYVGVSWLFRADPTKSAKDLGYLYLPQEPVDERTYSEYQERLKDPDLDNTDGYYEISDAECAGGACPIR